MGQLHRSFQAIFTDRNSTAADLQIAPLKNVSRDFIPSHIPYPPTPPRHPFGPQAMAGSPGEGLPALEGLVAALRAPARRLGGGGGYGSAAPAPMQSASSSGASLISSREWAAD